MQEPTVEFFGGVTEEEVKKNTQKTPKPKKTGTPNPELIGAINNAKQEYYDFIQMYPEYEMKMSNIKTEIDLNDFLLRFDNIQRQQRLDYAIKDLPMNFYYGTRLVTRQIGFRYAVHYEDKRLFDKWVRFESILDKNFETLHPLLVETLKKYPILQQSGPHVLIRLAMEFKMMWDLADVDPLDEKEEIKLPDDFN